VRVEVRCCCDPGKLLGWVDLPGVPHVNEGDRFVFRLNADRLLQAKPASPYLESALMGRVEKLELSVAFWHQWHEALDVCGGAARTMIGGLAFRSDDTPIETLRRIIGFQEAE